MRPCLIHIPKTGGSALKELLFQNCGKKVLCDNTRLAEYIWKLRCDPTEFDWYSAFALHIPLPTYRQFGSNLFYLAVVRNPVDRRQSLYTYCRRTKDHPLYEMANHLSFEEFVEADSLANHQCYLLCGGRPSFSQARYEVFTHRAAIADFSLLQQFANRITKLFRWDRLTLPIVHATKLADKPAVTAKALRRIQDYDREDFRLWKWVEGRIIGLEG